MKKVFLAAGGTAGHINGAIALSEILAQHNYQALFISSQRKIDYRVLKDFSSQSWHLNSKALKGKGAVETIINIIFNLTNLTNYLFEMENTLLTFDRTLEPIETNNSDEIVESYS